MYNCQIVLIICSVDYNDAEKYVLSLSDSELILPTKPISENIDEDLSSLFFSTMSYHSDWLNNKIVKAENNKGEIKIYYLFKVPKTDTENWIKTSTASLIYSNLREIFLYV